MSKVSKFWFPNENHKVLHVKEYPDKPSESKAGIGYDSDTIITLDFVKLNPDAVTPTKAHITDACFDLYSCCDQMIPPHATILVSTGIATDIPNGYFGAIFARSGLATQKGLRPGNCVGVIDSDYRGEWMVALHNDMDIPQYVSKGDKIAQFTLLPVYYIELNQVESLNETERGTGGFGSTGN